MDGFSVGDIQLPADFEQQIAAQLASQGYDFAAQPSAPATAAPNFAVQQAATAAPAVSELSMVPAKPTPPPQPSYIGPPDTPNFAVNPSVDWAAYTNAYPDLAAAAAATGQDAATFGQQHYGVFGQDEGRSLSATPPPINPAFTVDKTGMVNEQGMGENPPTFAVQPPKVDESNFAVFGNNPTAKFGQAPDGKYYFQGAEISPQDFASLKQTNDAYLASRPAPNLTVAGATGAVNVAPGVTVNPQGLTNPQVPTITATPAAPFDYSKLSTGEPQLVAAGASYRNNATGQMVPAGTDHYVTYTNDGDFAGTVMVAPGQKIRMVDATNGDVVFEGTGPEGAKQATAIANAMSQDKGRKAAWKIEAENEQGGYTTQAAERYDPKKPSLFSKLLPIAVAILGAVLLPGVGAALAPGLFGASGAAALTGGTLLGGATALGAGLGAAAGTAGLGVVRGDPLKNILISSAISGLGAGVVGPAVGKFLSPVAGGISPEAAAATDFGAAVGGSGGLGTATITNAAGNTLGSTVGGAAANVAGGLGGGGGNWIQALDITAPARNAGVGALASAGGAGVGALAPDIISGSSGNDVLRGDPADDMKGQSQGDNTVEELVVTGRKLAEAAVANPYLDPNALAALVPGATVDMAMKAILDNPPKTDASPNTDNTIEEVVVRGELLKKALTPVQQGLIFGGLITAATLAAQLSAATGTTVTEGEAKKLMDSTKAPLGVAANAIGAGALVAGALGGGGGSGSGGTYSVPTGAGSPGTRSSLGSTFSAQLPTASPQFAARAPRDMAGVDWTKYGMGPERSFFSNVPQGAADRLAVPLTPSAGTASPASSSAPAAATTFSVVQNRLAQEMGRPFPPEGKRYIQRDDGVILLVDDNPEATYTGRSGTTKKVRDLSVAQGGFTTKPISDFAAANTPEVIANLRSVGGLPMKRGGRAQFAVIGNGDGREDLIAAQLSDGEYVFDAETVALLGNGSSKAGAQKLDQFRVNVRKHKGRELARGKFSVNAKRPEAYLAGGRT